MADDKKKHFDWLKEFIVPALIVVFGWMINDGVREISAQVADLERVIRTLHPLEQGTINLLTSDRPVEEVEVLALFAALRPLEQNGNWVASLSYMDGSIRETYYFDNLGGPTDETAVMVLSDCLSNARATTIALSALDRTWQPPDYVDLRGAYLVTSRAETCRSGLRAKLGDPDKLTATAVAPATLSEFAKEFPKLRQELEEYRSVSRH